MTAALRVRLRPNAPLYAGREARLDEVLPDGKWLVSFTDFQLLGKSYAVDPDHVSPVCKPEPSVLAEDVRVGDLIGLGPGLGLRVDQIVFDGDDGLLVGRAECEGRVADTRHGPLRSGQPYAAVVVRGTTLHKREGYRPEPIVIW